MDKDSKLSIVVMYSSCALTGIGSLFSLVTLIFNISYRKVRVIKMSSPNLNILVNAGAFIIYATCLTYGMPHIFFKDLTVFCQVTSFLVPVGFTFLYAPLLTKAWRVCKIFQRAPAKRVIIKDYKLFVIIVILFAIDICVLASWQVFDPLIFAKSSENIVVTQVKDTVEIIRTLHYVHKCYSNYASIWISGLYSYKVVILLYGIYLAWLIRQVALPAMNESSTIVLSATFAVLVSSLTIATGFWLRHMMEIVHVCIIIGLWLNATMVLSMLYVPKMYYCWYKKPEDQVLKFSFANSPILSQVGKCSETFEEEIYSLMAENRVLKKLVDEKSLYIDKLQNHVKLAGDRIQLMLHNDDARYNGDLECNLSSASQYDDDLRKMQQSLSLEHMQLRTIHNSQYYRQRKHSLNENYIKVNRKERHRGSHKSNELLYVPTSRKSLPTSSSLLTQSSQFSDEDGKMIPKPRLENGFDKKMIVRKSLNDISSELQNINGREKAFIKRRNDTNNNQLKVFDSPPPKTQLAGSIIKSFDLDRDSDTYSYLSNRLSIPRGRNDLGYNYDSDSSLYYVNSIDSRDSSVTFRNIGYFPSFADQNSKKRQHNIDKIQKTEIIEDTSNKKSKKRIEQRQPQTSNFPLRVEPPGTILSSGTEDEATAV